MKKLFALLLTLALLCACALAEKVTLEGTNLTLEIGDLEEYELTWEDQMDDMVLCLGNADETLECDIWVMDAEGCTLKDMEEEMAEEEGCVSCGYTTINGIEAYFWYGEADGEIEIDYFIVNGDTLVQISFLCANEAAAQLSGTIMNTLMQ